MPQADEWQSPESYSHRLTLQPAPEAASKPIPLPGRVRWFETEADLRWEPNSKSAHERTPQGDAGTAARRMPQDAAIGLAAGHNPSRNADRSAIPIAGPFPESISGLVHDARNMVLALDLYCDLLEEPGVLHASYRHYAGELRRVGAANRRLLEKLSGLGDQLGDQLDDQLENRLDNPAEAPDFPPPPASGPVALSPMARSGRRQVFVLGQTVRNLAEEVQARRNLLGAMLGHGMTLGVSIRGGARPIAMAGDDLTRVMVNLARNAAEAMPGGGHLQIALEEGPEFLTLSFADNGPGIPEHALEAIFSPGFSTHVGLEPDRDAATAWPVRHRGLGLSIVRSLVTSAGGAVWAANRVGDLARPDRVKPDVNGSGALDDLDNLDAPDNFDGCGDGSPPHGAVILVEFPLLSANIGPAK